MSASELKRLADALLWYDCAQLIKEMASRGVGESEKQAIVEVFRSAAPRMHPMTSTETAIVVSRLLAGEDAVALLEEALETISGMFPSKYQDLRTSLQMHVCLLKINGGNLEGRDAEVLRWAKGAAEARAGGSARGGRANYELFTYVAYRLYSARRNTEAAQKYLLLHVAATRDASYLSDLIRLSIASRDFYDFSSVIGLPGFSEGAEARLANLLVAFRDGNTQAVRQEEALIGEIIGGVVNAEDAEAYKRVVMEKAYLTNIMKTCFASNGKSVSLAVLREQLGVPQDALLHLLIRALGIGAMSGWIDAQADLFHVSKIMPHALSSSDIAEMKAKFVNWRSKVQQVLSAVE